ncbi:MAG TPA: YhjD/YihY/BrkB family envelope integrity protein [Acidimicrobiales bacterium]|nr:YhjD/YihY/BrkB family envelope integrity protein [Acidimicrobiales bacterium]
MTAISPEPLDEKESAVQRAKRVATETRARGEAAWDRVQNDVRPNNRAVDTALSTYEQDVSHGGGLLAGALAYRFFFWILPFALVLVGVLGFSKDAGERAGVFGFASGAIADAETDASKTRWLALIVGLWALWWASGSLLKALRVTHALIWGVALPPVSKKWLQILFLNATIIGLAVILGAEHKARQSSPTGGLIITLAFIFVVAVLWVFVSWNLPHAAATWNELVPGALLLAVAAQGVHLFNVYFLGNKIERASATYGMLGAAAAILLSLFLMCRIVVASAELNAYLNTRRRAAHHADVPNQERRRWHIVLQQDADGDADSETVDVRDDSKDLGHRANL